MWGPRAIRLASATAALLAFACFGGPQRPATLDTRTDLCAYCRMPVSNQRYAAQIVVPGEDPRFFDDIGCLSNFIQRNTAPARSTTAYVADHRTGEWVSAATAIYTMVPALETPMSSHLIAHGSAASRSADIVAASGTIVPPSQLFPLGAPDGNR